MKKLSSKKREEIIAKLKQGLSTREIALICGVSRSSVSRLRNSATILPPKQVGGRPRAISGRMVRNVIRLFTTGQVTNTVQARKVLKRDYYMRVSCSTIRRTLRRAGIKAYTKKKKPWLNRVHRINRVKHCRWWKEFDKHDWKRIIWSDESKFNVFGSDGREYCWKRPGERLLDHHVKPSIKHGGGCVMVWGCITWHGVGYLCKIDGNMDAKLYCKILKDDLLGTIDYYGMDIDDVMFQHDNDPKHTARLTKDWLKENDVNVLSWPAQSPDLNPIENMWNMLDRKIRDRKKLPTSRDSLWTAIQEEWEKITKEECRRVIGTMPERIKAVLKAKGGYTTW